MWIKLDLDGIDFHFQITGYRKCNRDNWDEQWCKVEVTLQSPCWIDYQISSDILLSCEVEELRDSIEKLIQDSLTEQEELEFVEPDLTFVLNPKKDLRETGNYSYITPGHEILDIDADLHVHFWNGGLTANYISLCFDRSDLEKLLVYLRLTTNLITEQSPEVQNLFDKDILR